MLGLSAGAWLGEKAHLGPQRRIRVVGGPPPGRILRGEGRRSTRASGFGCVTSSRPEDGKTVPIESTETTLTKLQDSSAGRATALPAKPSEDGGVFEVTAQAPKNKPTGGARIDGS